MESHHKITGQELIPVKLWRNSDARVFWPPFLPFDWFLAIHVTRAQFVVFNAWPSLPLLFTNLNFYKLEQSWLLSMLQSNSCYFCEFWEIGGPQEVPFYLYSVPKFVIIFLRYLLELFFFLAMQSFRLRFLRNLRTVRGPSLTLFFLGMNVCKIYYSWHWFDVNSLLKFFYDCNENSCYFCAFSTFADFSRPFFAL